VRNSANGTNIEKGKRQGTTQIEDGESSARLLRFTKGGRLTTSPAVYVDSLPEIFFGFLLPSSNSSFFFKGVLRELG
jgi:hypothetical protein